MEQLIPVMADRTAASSAGNSRLEAPGNDKVAAAAAFRNRPHAQEALFEQAPHFIEWLAGGAVFG